jgi:hypothetical protein
MSKARELSTSGKSGADNVRGDARWANFRFSIIGPLLAAPPEPGELRTQLAELASKQWCHPITGDWTRFGASTIEREAKGSALKR